jgi:site-specific recombinase XerC
VKALLKACEGPGSLERRDRALILAYLDTGNRLSEIGNLRLLGDDDAGSDVDLDGGVLGVLGKEGACELLPRGRVRSDELWKAAQIRPTKVPGLQTPAGSKRSLRRRISASAEGSGPRTST